MCDDASLLTTELECCRRKRSVGASLDDPRRYDIFCEIQQRHQEFSCDFHVMLDSMTPWQSVRMNAHLETGTLDTSSNMRAEITYSSPMALPEVIRRECTIC